MKHKLISVALIAILLCMVLGNSIGCTSTTNYTLTMSSTAGGSVTPAVGAHTYSAGAGVNLIATPDGGYRFVNWTAPAGNFTDATAAHTTFTMPAQDVTVTAHFALGTFIDNVPDTSVPPTSGLPNYCAPIAMVNILGYWDEVMGLLNAYNVTAFLVPHNLNTVADLVGYFMDTNNIAPPARGNGADGHFGTYAKDIKPGALEFVRWDGANLFLTPPPALPAGKLGHVWTGTNDYQTINPVGFPFYQVEIDAGRPLVVCFRWWNLIFGLNVTDPESEEIISVYQWGTPSGGSSDPPEDWNGSYGETCIGHAVTGVGYILNWDPDGSGTAFSQGNYIIVHDTWGTTPKNIAVFWPGPWNSSHAVNPGS